MRFAMYEIILDTLKDGVRLLPFLLITYIIMEYMEHKMSAHTRHMVQASGRFGPLIGSIAGIFPQCGFSAAAASFYAGRVISRGTLIAIFLSTSDEMLPVLISQKVPVNFIVSILGMKVVIGIAAGFLVDLVFSVVKKEPKAEMDIHHMCEHDHCHCEGENSLFKSAVVHTVQIFFFILLVSFILNIVISIIGRDSLSQMILNRPVIGAVLSGIVGLIPNCASSVVITQLYLDGAMSLGSMMAGLLVGAGVGLIVLYKSNDSMRENLRITGLLYVIGVGAGIAIDFLGITL